MTLSRWDPLVNHMAHGGMARIPICIIFRCEWCESVEYHKLQEGIEVWPSPLTVTRTYLLQCARCGRIEATIAQTYLIGAGSPL